MFCAPAVLLNVITTRLCGASNEASITGAGNDPTNSTSVDDVLVANALLGLKVAVRLCEPADSDDVVKDAEPDASATVFSVDAPSLKVTVPAGGPPSAVVVTVAVSV